MANYSKPVFDFNTRAALFGGHTYQELAEIFGVNPGTAKKALSELEPFDKRGMVGYWTIQQAAPLLVTPTMDIVEQIKSLRPADLPPLLQKDFWAAQRSRQDFLEGSKDLWRTEQVLRVMARVMRVVADQMGMLEDTVERQTGITEEQRKIIRAMVDGARREMHTAMVESFKDYRGDKDRDDLHNTAEAMDALPATAVAGDDSEEW